MLADEAMKKGFTTVVALWFCLAAASVWAQNTVSPTPQKPAEGRVIVPEEPVQVSPTDATTPKRPSRPERQELTPEIKDKLKQFNVAREAYIAKQTELEKKARGASDEERRKIREQLKERRERWLEQAKKFRDESRDRLREIRTDSPSLREALEEKRPPRPGLD